MTKRYVGAASSVIIMALLYGAIRVIGLTNTGFFAVMWGVAAICLFVGIRGILKHHFLLLAWIVKGGDAVVLGSVFALLGSLFLTVPFWVEGPDADKMKIRTTPVEVSNLASGVASVYAGGQHTCVLTDVGRVKCWGRNDFGQLGDGSVTSSNVPGDVEGLESGIVALAAGANHSCALAIGGTVSCWGLFFEPSDTPSTAIEVADGAVAVATGVYTCYITSLGQVKCARTDQPELEWTTLTLDSPAIEVTASARKEWACALKESGRVSCWGINRSGQLGQGTISHSRILSGAVEVKRLTGGTTFVSAGSDHACAVTIWEVVHCWGSDSYGQLGNGENDKTPFSGPWEVVGLETGALAVAAGGVHTCSVSTSGTVACWGNNGSGQLGNGSAGVGREFNRSGPTRIRNLKGIVAVTAGQAHTCALTGEGSVKCWGLNDYGQLGN